MRLIALTAVLALIAASLPAQSAVDSATIVVHLIERPVGHESYLLRRSAAGLTLSSTLDFVDRGSHIQLESTLRTKADFTPTAFSATGKTYRFVNADVAVTIAHDTARVRNLGDSSRIGIEGPFFTSRGYSPLAGRALLIGYWEKHGRPAFITNVPGPPEGGIAVEFRGIDTVTAAAGAIPLRRYSVNGVVWGREAVWLDPRGNFAAVLSRVHILPLEGVRSDLENALPQLQASAVRDRMRDLVALRRSVPTLARDSFALVGGRVVDGTNRAPIDEATVVIRGGRIVAVGSSREVAVPVGYRTLDARGKTILPGLWDMHGHVSQIEWAPAYLAAGVTSVRDMGGESLFLTAFRDTLAAGGAIGPQLLLAGLIDGPGPNGFGAVIASSAEEGEALVDSYHNKGFRQIKLYNSITAPVAGAIIRRAHSLEMTVTGHVPVAMGLRAIVDSGMDNIAHLPFNGSESPAEMDQKVAFLAAKHTVLDPTVAWNELLEHAPSTPIAAFEPGIDQTPPPLFFNYASVKNKVDSAEAAKDRALGLHILKALHDAGVPIVAGTDGGIPGHSLLREIELTVEAGLTPLEAIQTATVIPARVMGMEQETGTIQMGKVADLLVLDADPLASLANIRTARWVIREGRVYECRKLWQVAGFIVPPGN